MQIIDKILGFFNWCFSRNIVKVFIAYATLLNHICLIFIAVQCFLSSLGYSTSTAVFIYGILKPFIAVNLFTLLIQGYLIFRHRFCKWTLIAWLGGFTFSIFWITQKILEYFIGYKAGFVVHFITLLILSYFIIFVIINLLKVRFRCCDK